MNVPQSKQQVTGTVTTELNAYGAMTLRSEDGRSLQIVDAACTQITEQLETLDSGEKVTVTLKEAPCRGNGWCAISVTTECSRDKEKLVA